MQPQLRETVPGIPALGCCTLAPGLGTEVEFQEPVSLGLSALPAFGPGSLEEDASSFGCGKDKRQKEAGRVDWDKIIYMESRTGKGVGGQKSRL